MSATSLPNWHSDASEFEVARYAGRASRTIMHRYERLLLDARSDLCLVVGDVIHHGLRYAPEVVCAVPMWKQIRSGDWTMPEEINRMVTDSITNWFFTTSEFANDNLRRSGVATRISLSGHDDRYAPGEQVACNHQLSGRNSPEG